MKVPMPAISAATLIAAISPAESSPPLLPCPIGELVAIEVSVISVLGNLVVELIEL